MKKCTHCFKEKGEQEFRIRMSRGKPWRIPTCRQCEKEYRIKNRRKLSAASMKWAKEHRGNRLKAFRKHYLKHREKRIAYSIQWAKDHKSDIKSRREINRLKVDSRQKLNDAIKAGNIFRQPCQECGKIRVHGHHEDYNKPLEVIWLCPYHHMMRHRSDYQSNKNTSGAQDGINTPLLSNIVNP